MAEEAEDEAARLRFVALVHRPLALESGLGAETVRDFVHSEPRALAAASARSTRSVAGYSLRARLVEGRAPDARGCAAGEGRARDGGGVAVRYTRAESGAAHATTGPLD